MMAQTMMKVGAKMKHTSWTFGTKNYPRMFPNSMFRIKMISESTY